ncbi:MAG: AarF/ABC1/UbiB kinase family protein [Limnobacter sp.]|uniref:ABC1 kinase family protein n=1 Tax=Limnobacter sp. TaxID=2003368 RepID=UPI0032ECA2C1
MSSSKNPPKGNNNHESAVPAGRFARLSRFGALATTVAGSVVKNGTKQLAQGKRPSLSKLLLTPKNAMRVADQLAQLRGAAMKLGQLVSMDAGDMLPPQLAEIMARLRQDAKHMPRKQLLAVLEKEWGENWHDQVREFNLTPIAAASIGQVHEAISLEGEKLAIKIQYPGVRDSIDSDIDNVATILRFTGLVPKTFDLAALLTEAKKQLHEEADYLREAACIVKYAKALGNDELFEIPTVNEGLTTRSILAMRYVEGVPIEQMAHATQPVRDKIATALFELLFKELLGMRLMQTDPNFANYRYNPKTGKVILLDFGATRGFDKELVAGYVDVMQAAQASSRTLMEKAATRIGYFDSSTQPHHRELVLDLMDLACEPLCTEGSFDFGNSDLAARIRDKGFELGEDRKFWHAPPIDCLFIHRKLGGLFLLLTRLKARVNVGACGFILIENAR